MKSGIRNEELRMKNQEWAVFMAACFFNAVGFGK
jgi:hypothetical protein